MEKFYYTNEYGAKDGPHDLVTIMRRIRAARIKPDTWVYVGESLDATPAGRVDELKLFFSQPTETPRPMNLPRARGSLTHALSQGWNFISEQMTMTVFAGGILLVSVLFGMLIREMLSNNIGFAAGGFMFVILQSYYFAVCLRVYRGQTPSIDFIDQQLSPLSGSIIGASLIFALLIGGGFMLFIIPGILAMMVYIFVPLLIIDHKYTVMQAIGASFSLLRRMDSASMMKLIILILMYLPAVALIATMPIALPLFAGALCSIYEELSAT